MAFKRKLSKFQNKCLEIKRLKKDYFKEARKYGVMTSTEYWKKLKPFLTNKGCFLGDQISTTSQEGMKKSSQKILTSIVSIIVEKSSGNKPSSLRQSANPSLDETTVGKIIDTNRDHSSFIAIKLSVIQNRKFNLPQDINKIINLLSSDKATDPVGIPLKLLNCL